MIKQCVAISAAGLLLAGQAFAAEATVAQLGAVKGSVMVSQGGSYAPASSAAALRTGDRVVATDGSAQLKYSDGCVVNVAPKAVATVGERSPCSANAKMVGNSQSLQWFEGDAGYLIPLILVGAIVIAGIIEVADGSEDPPTSP